MLEYDFENSIGYWVCRAAHALEQSLNVELSPHDITFRQWQVLAHLTMLGEATQAQLADRMSIEAPTLVGIIVRMERDGWITRHASPTDRRKKMIRASQRVEPVWKKMVAAARRIRARAVQGLSEEQLVSLLDLLCRIRDNLIEIDVSSWESSFRPPPAATVSFESTVNSRRARIKVGGSR